MVIVNQPDCPIKIEDVRFFLTAGKGHITQGYKLRNISSKPIASFTVTSWSITGSGGTLPVALTGTERFLYPGETFDSLGGEKYEVLQLTQELRDKLKLKGDLSPAEKMKNIYFVIIDWVRFTDGSVYQDKKTSEALQEYLYEHYRYPDK